MSAFFSSAVTNAFRNWTSVATHRDPGARLYHVHLTLTERALEARARDKSELVGDLFARSDARYAVELVNKMRKNTGLIRYGRKRR